MDLLQTFQLYSSAHPEPLTPQQIALLRREVTRHICDTTDALIPTYTPRDIEDELRVSADKYTRADLSVHYVDIRCTDIIPRQSFVFVQGQESLMLSSGTKHPINEHIRELLESFSPLGLQELALPKDRICHTLDALFENIDADRIGDIDLVYTNRGPSLRTITISVPKKDAVGLLATNRALVSSIHEYIRKSTTVRLDRLDMAKFVSNVISISGDGRLRMGSEKGVWVVLSELTREREKNGEYEKRA